MAVCCCQCCINIKDAPYSAVGDVLQTTTGKPFKQLSLLAARMLPSSNPAGHTYNFCNYGTTQQHHVCYGAIISVASNISAFTRTADASPDVFALATYASKEPLILVVQSLLQIIPVCRG